ncbi:hypothetical protein [Longimicrobium sp.]|uniref:hypothetical protein n=1 Tax=Longimicrobium sp. TaxID=2029185 RepID=UPI002E374A1A|nr:hypothetical protein [Longimicrobium sp.]HEX6040745.1 hypothetical protein [Longimicrobium sp.]
MARTGSYCRAFYAREFAGFDAWRPDLSRLRTGAEGTRSALEDEDVLYLQEDFRVTDGVYLDENVVFADAGPGWREFCAGTLGFAPPAAEEAEPAAAAA